MKISQKLLLMFLLTTGLLVASSSAAIHYSISTGFSSYLAKSEMKTIEALPLLLSQEFKRQGSWQKVFSDPILMDRLFAENENEVMGGSPDPRRGFPDQRGGFPDSMGPPPPFPAFRMELFHRVGVFDSAGSLLWGNEGAKSSAASMPLRLDGKEIGTVRLAPSQTLNRDVEEEFLAEQDKSLILVFSLSIALSALAAVCLSRHIVEAIEVLVLATRRLIAGDFNTRVELSRSDELGQLAKDLNILAATLEQHDRAQKQWITDTSHELRTPVAVLRAQVEAIQDGVQEPNSRTIEILHNEVMTLNKLIDGLYDLARFDVHKLKFSLTPIDLGGILQEEIDSFAERFQKRNIKLQLIGVADLQCAVNGDAYRLKQLISNLLENSLRYTDEGGQLKISANLKDSFVSVCFDDSEPGVAEDLLLTIFERFYRVESSRSRIYGGSGLGLAICKTIAEGHGGSLRASKSSLGGLSLELLIPVIEVTKNG